MEVEQEEIVREGEEICQIVLTESDDSSGSKNEESEIAGVGFTDASFEGIVMTSSSNSSDSRTGMEESRVVGKEKMIEKMKLK